MSIRFRFFLYSFLLIFLSVCLGELLVIWTMNTTHLVLLSLLLIGFIVLFRFIYKDFLTPMLSIQKWVNHYKQQHQTTQNEQNIFVSVHQVLDHLVSESEDLYDEMNDVLQAQIKRLSEKSSLLETLYAISSSLNEIRDLDTLLKHFLGLFINMTEANSGVIRMRDNYGDLNIVKVMGNQDDVGQITSINQSDCLCYKIAHNTDVHVQFSVHSCEKCVGNASQKSCSYGTIFIPLQHQNQILGMVSLFFDKAPSLNQDERSLLKTIGDHLAIALDKIKIDTKAQRLSLSQERLFLSQDIHDSLSQILYSVGLQTSALLDIIKKDSKQTALKKAKDIQTGIHQANHELRNLLNNFRKPLDNNDLMSHLKNIAQNFQKDTQVATYVHCVDLLKIPIESEQQVIYMTQEILTNVKKHAQANTVRILMSKNSLMIEDDGVGFDAKQNKNRQGYHIGLNILKERAARIGAKLHIESEIGEGTQITLNLSL